MVEQRRYSDSLASLMVVLLLLMPLGNARAILAVFVVGLGPMLMFYRHSLRWSDVLGTAVAAAVTSILVAAL